MYRVLAIMGSPRKGDTWHLTQREAAQEPARGHRCKSSGAIVVIIIVTLVALELAGCQPQVTPPSDPVAIEVQMPAAKPAEATPAEETSEAEEASERAGIQWDEVEKTTNPRILAMEEVLNQYYGTEKHDISYEILQVREIKQRGIVSIAYKIAGEPPSDNVGIVIARVGDDKIRIVKEWYWEDGPLTFEGLSPDELGWIQEFSEMGMGPALILTYAPRKDG